MLKKPENVYGGAKAEELKLQLSNILNKIKILKTGITNGKSKIKEYCDILCNNIIQVTERAHQYLEKQKASFMEIIDLHDIETQKQFESNDEFTGDFDKLINDIYLFGDKWIEYTKRFSVDEIKLSEASTEAMDCFTKIERELLELKERTKKSKTMTFDINPRELESTLIGTLAYEKKEYLKKKFENLENFDIHLEGLACGELLAVDSLKSGDFIVCYQNHEESSLSLSKLNRRGQLCGQALILSKSSKIHDLKLAKTNGMFFVHASFYSFKSATVNNCLKSFDNDLNFLKEISLDSSLNSLASLSDEIFCLVTVDAGFNRILVYDTELNLIETLGQKSSSEAFYFSLNVTHLRACDKFFFLLENHEMVIVWRETGLVFKRFEFLSDDFEVYLQKFLICVNPESNELIYLDFDGYVIYKTKIGIEERIKLLSDGFEDICFLDEKSKRLWFDNSDVKEEESLKIE
jgi:hypothetical protein